MCPCLTDKLGVQLYPIYPDFYLKHRQSMDLRAQVNDLKQALEEPVFRGEMLTLLLNYLLK
jgi:hypothetical protein